jgi:hypothetical protein
MSLCIAQYCLYKIMYSVLFEQSAIVSLHFTPTGTSKMYRIIIESIIFTVTHCVTVPKNFGFSNFGNHPYRLFVVTVVLRISLKISDLLISTHYRYRRLVPQNY